MRFLSICSGIEAASVAFHPLGWQALAFAEIEPFPCSLLAHHYPQVPNLGDLTRWREWSPQLLAQADVLCGGTPCQAFSVAGLRGSLSDERGNLTLTFCHLFDEIDRIRHLHGRPPAVCLWENVPGVLNTDDNAFGHFLAGLAGEDVPLTPPGSRWTDAGYVRGPRRAVAWRVLDAQYFGLAQRRERVFVVASADPAFDPAAVLFELDGLRRDTPPRRGPGEGTATGTLRSSDGGSDLHHARAGHVLGERMTNEGVPEVAGTLNANGKAAGSATQQDAEQGMLIPMAFGGNNTSGPIEQAPALNANRGCHNPGDFEAGTLLVQPFCAPLTGNAYADNASEESKLVPEVVGALPTQHTPNGHGCAGINNQTVAAGHVIPELFAFSSKDHGADASQDVSPVLQAQNPTAVAYEAESEGQREESPEAFAFHENQRGELTVNDTAGSLKVGGGKPGQGYPAVAFQPGNLARGAGSAPSMDVFPTLKSDHGRGKSDQDPHVACQEPSAATQWRVRRLTPEECEMLQGFPIGYTLIPGTSSKKRKGEDLRDTIDYLISLGVAPAEAEVLAHSPDGPRYKALGNSWAVPVARWIARRIDACTKALSLQ